MLQAGLNVTAIGISVVFILLGLLVGIIRVMSAICRMIEGAMPAAAGGPDGSGPALHSDQQLVSVISAAIAAHRTRQ